MRRRRAGEHVLLFATAPHVGGDGEQFLHVFKGGSLRSPPAARLRALAALASSPAAT